MGILWDFYSATTMEFEPGEGTMEHLIITISRQYGCGGPEIGKAAAERLGIAFYDRSAIDAIAHERGQDREYISEWQSHTTSSAIWGAEDAFPKRWGLSEKPPYYFDRRQMFLIQSRLIYELAEQGPAIFLGRCADYVLKHWPRCLRVFIHADEDTRALRVYDEYFERTGDLAQKISIVDRCRASYYRRNTGQVWGEEKRYHLFLDGGFLGIEGCVNAILAAAGNLQSAPGKEAGAERSPC